MKTIVLTGNPISTNQIYRNTCRGGFSTTYMSEAGKVRKEEYIWSARSQWKAKPLEGDVRIKVVLYFGDKKRRDWDNFHKLSMDAFTGIVWLDDSQVIEAHVVKEYSKTEPRIEITIL